MGCTYRERASLLRNVNSESASVKAAQDDAIDYLCKAKKLANEKGYDILFVDSCEDLAQTYYQARDFKRAENLTD